MNIEHAKALIALAAHSASAPGTDLSLRLGAEVVARIVSAPAQGGRGLIALAGRALHADLPPGLVAGERLPLVVAGRTPAGEILLRRVEEEAVPVPAPAPAAVELPPTMLPGGAVASALLRSEEREADGAAGRRSRPAEAAVVLEGGPAGRIELRLRLGAGGITAAVVVDGETVPLAQSAVAELASALERATGLAATVGVTAHAQGVEPDGVEAYA
jgi:hypothetical protein